jgi:hypothetical protein
MLRALKERRQVPAILRKCSRMKVYEKRLHFILLEESVVDNRRKLESVAGQFDLEA